MWSRERGALARRIVQTGAAMAMAALTAGCFQPLYGDRSVTGQSSNIRDALASVDVAQISAPPGSPQARMAVELRNDLTFALNGSGTAYSPTHELRITITTAATSMIVDPTTARAEFEIVSADATYNLVDIKTKKVVFTSSATARTSYDVPGQQQRYARLAGQRDSQMRAAKLLSEQIRNRVASHFAAGT